MEAAAIEVEIADTDAVTIVEETVEGTEEETVAVEIAVEIVEATADMVVEDAVEVASEEAADAVEAVEKLAPGLALSVAPAMRTSARPWLTRVSRKSGRVAPACATCGRTTRISSRSSSSAAARMWRRGQVHAAPGQLLRSIARLTAWRDLQVPRGCRALAGPRCRLQVRPVRC